jgi:hypothetical protein
MFLQGACGMKLFYGGNGLVIATVFNVGAFITASHLCPCLIFASKTRNLPRKWLASSWLDSSLPHMLD